MAGGEGTVASPIASVTTAVRRNYQLFFHTVEFYTIFLRARAS